MSRRLQRLLSTALRLGLVVACALMFTGVAPGQTNDASLKARQGAVKALHMYNILHFIEWARAPQRQTTTQQPALTTAEYGRGGKAKVFRICLWGNKHPFGEALAYIVSKNPQKYALAVYERIPSATLLTCDVLYMDPATMANADSVFSYTNYYGILTISDAAGFIDKGGMIGLREFPDGAIGVEINDDIARKSGVRVRAELMEAAYRVLRQGAPIQAAAGGGTP